MFNSNIGKVMIEIFYPDKGQKTEILEVFYPNVGKLARYNRAHIS